MDQVIIFDPGETIGIAEFIDEKLTKAFQISGEDRLSELWHYLAFQIPEKVGYESFGLFQHRMHSQIGNQFITVEVIGVIKLFCEVYEIESWCWNSSKVKAIWDDKKLKKFGYYIPGKPHANDAIRHGLTYFKEHVKLGDQWLEN